jgi:phosphotransferase system IIA component
MRVLAPISGRAVPLAEVPDEVFAEGMAGQGCAIVPEASGEAVAPVSGILVKLFEGGHAFGIATDGGIVEAGQPIVRFDLEEIRAGDYDPVTPVLVTNDEDHPVTGVRTGEIQAGELLFEAGH